MVVQKALSVFSRIRKIARIDY